VKGNTVCGHCGSATNLFLCNECLHRLAEALTELAWLLTQLDTTVRRQDKLNTGAIGRASDNPSPINLGAMETARDTRATLLTIVTTIAKTGTGRTPQLASVTSSDLAHWLAANTAHIAKHPDAPTILTTITHLVDDDERGRPGPLFTAINRTDRRFAGPCPTIRGHNHRGERIECGTMLYAAFDEDFTRCPRCETEVDVDKNRMKAAVDRDLLPEPKLLEVLADLGEKVSRVKLYEWIKAGRLQRRGWIHGGAIVQYRIRRGDPTVFSLSQARQLRWHEIESKEKSHA
jgi:hypothetical protein